MIFFLSLKVYDNKNKQGTLYLDEIFLKIWQNPQKRKNDDDANEQFRVKSAWEDELSRNNPFQRQIVKKKKKTRSWLTYRVDIHRCALIGCTWSWPFKKWSSLRNRQSILKRRERKKWLGRQSLTVIINNSVTAPFTKRPRPLHFRLLKIYKFKSIDTICQNSFFGTFQKSQMNRKKKPDGIATNFECVCLCNNWQIGLFLFDNHNNGSVRWQSTVNRKWFGHFCRGQWDINDESTIVCNNNNNNRMASFLFLLVDKDHVRPSETELIVGHVE